jgi:hypothetical protein
MTKADNIKAFYANKWAEKKRLERKAIGGNMASRRYNSLSLRIWENMVARINDEYTGSIATQSRWLKPPIL